jgi:hypothetical protein
VVYDHETPFSFIPHLLHCLCESFVFYLEIHFLECIDTECRSTMAANEPIVPIRDDNRKNGEALLRKSAGETEVLTEKSTVHQCHFANHKTHINGSVIKFGLPR